MLFGANPLVAHASLGFVQVDPVRRLKQARERGLKLIVLDSRHAETARHADLFLQPYPGQDAAIAGSILREILAQGGRTRTSALRTSAPKACRRCAARSSRSRPTGWSARAGLAPGQVHAAAKLFAHDSKVGSVTMATGPSMAPTPTSRSIWPTAST